MRIDIPRRIGWICVWLLFVLILAIAAGMDSWTTGLVLFVVLGIAPLIALTAIKRTFHSRQQQAAESGLTERDKIVLSLLPQFCPHEPTCPHCEKVLPKMPKARSKCPSCREWIYIWHNPKLGRPQLITSETADKLRAAMNEYYTMGSKKERHERWADLNRRLLDATRQNDLWEIGSLHFEQALQLHQEGKDFFKVLQLHAKFKLLDYQQQGHKKVQIMGGSDSCPNCQRLVVGKLITIVQALKEMPVPCNECTMDVENPEAEGHEPGWCRCNYTAQG